MALFESIFARSRNSVSWISHALNSTVNVLRSASQTDATKPMGSTRLDFESWLIGLAYTDVSAESRCVVLNEGITWNARRPWPGSPFIGYLAIVLCLSYAFTLFRFYIISR